METLEKIKAILEQIEPNTPEHLPITIPNDYSGIQFTLEDLRDLVAELEDFTYHGDWKGWDE